MIVMLEHQGFAGPSRRVAAGPSRRVAAGPSRRVAAGPPFTRPAFVRLAFVHHRVADVVPHSASAVGCIELHPLAVACPSFAACSGTAATFPLAAIASCPRWGYSRSCKLDQSFVVEAYSGIIEHLDPCVGWRLRKELLIVVLHVGP
jgi:hypothetical protein